MNALVLQVQVEIRERQLWPAGQRGIVAVSGGLDSMALLHIFKRLSREGSNELAVAHFNHGLRGNESDGDETFVRHIADSLEVPVWVERGDVRECARAEGVSLEMAGRRLRHEFLAKAAREFGAARVATGHHADDQVELFFLRLLRGSGAEGLGGMKWASPSPADPGIELVRPFLGLRRAELESFVQEEGIQFREDASNAAGAFAVRNRVRHEWLPWLRRNHGDSVDGAILRTMELVREESSWVQEQAVKWLSAEGGEAFGRLHPALQRRVIQIQLRAAGVEAAFELVERLRQFPDQCATVSPERQAWRDAAGRVHCGAVFREHFLDDELEVDLSPARGDVRFGGVIVRWETERCPGDGALWGASAKGVEYLAADRVGERIRLRHWRRGDRFQPLGMEQPVKLQDLFVNLKVPREMRHERVVAAAAGGEIFWVEGVRIGERFKLDKGTRRRLKWQWRRAESAFAGEVEGPAGGGSEGCG